MDGAEKIASIMEKIRRNPPRRLAGHDVLAVRDYKKGVIMHPEDGREEPTGLPESNVLYFELSDDAWCCARPSGTEPKIKFYMGVRGQNLEDAAAGNEALTQAIRELI